MHSIDQRCHCGWPRRCPPIAETCRHADIARRLAAVPGRQGSLWTRGAPRCPRTRSSSWWAARSSISVRSGCRPRSVTPRRAAICAAGTDGVLFLCVRRARPDPRGSPMPETAATTRFTVLARASTPQGRSGRDRPGQRELRRHSWTRASDAVNVLTAVVGYISGCWSRLASGVAALAQNQSNKVCRTSSAVCGDDHHADRGPAAAPWRYRPGEPIPGTKHVRRADG